MRNQYEELFSPPVRRHLLAKAAAAVAVAADALAAHAV